VLPSLVIKSSLGTSLWYIDGVDLFQHSILIPLD